MYSNHLAIYLKFNNYCSWIRDEFMKSIKFEPHKINTIAKVDCSSVNNSAAFYGAAGMAMAMTMPLFSL